MLGFEKSKTIQLLSIHNLSYRLTQFGQVNYETVRGPFDVALYVMCVFLNLP